MIKGVTHAHLGPIWDHTEPSDVPYFPSQFLNGAFFCHFLLQSGSNSRFVDLSHITLVFFKFSAYKGQKISEEFFLASISPKKQ